MGLLGHYTGDDLLIYRQSEWIQSSCHLCCLHLHPSHSVSTPLCYPMGSPIPALLPGAGAACRTESEVAWRWRAQGDAGAVRTFICWQTFLQQKEAMSLSKISNCEIPCYHHHLVFYISVSLLRYYCHPLFLVCRLLPVTLLLCFSCFSGGDVLFSCQFHFNHWWK